MGPRRLEDDGEIERRVCLIRPMEQHYAPLRMMEESHWEGVDRAAFAAASLSVSVSCFGNL